MKKGVTIIDIAKKLNMAPSTVSKALNDHHSISSITKERVKALATEWNYVPNEAARHFKQNKSQTLAVVIPNLLDQAFILIIRGIEKVAAQHHYNVIISESYDNAVKEAGIINDLISKRVDGVIIAIAKNSISVDKLKRLEEVGTPVTLICRPLSTTTFNIVTSDTEDGAVKMIRFLQKKGHKRIAHIMGPKSFETSNLRLQAYKKALEVAKIKFDPALVKESSFTEKSTAKAVDELIKMENAPTAIFVFKNYLSLDIINHLKVKHPNYLNQLAIVGYGELPLYRYLDHKPLASIDERPGLIGEKAADIVFQRINKAENEDLPFGHFKIPCSLKLNLPL